MKKILYTAACALAFSQMSIAQTTLVQQPSTLKTKGKMTAVTMQKKALTGFENINDSKPAVPPSASARALGKSVGITTYDLGSNGAVKPRLINYGKKKVSAAFTYGTGDMANGFPDRGSGYNTTDANGKFAAPPKKRIESVRTGFTNLCADADDTEYLFAHRAGTTAAPAYRIVMSKKLKGATTWTESEVPSTITGGMLWSSVAIGGKNGKSIHLVALTAPTGTSTNGTIYKGIDGAMVYFRSLDGGATWDKKGILLPGIDSTRYNRMGSDAYSVAVKGDKVVIASYGDWYDTEIWISENNGDTFKKTTVFDFPLANYKIDDLYEVKDIPTAPEGFDSLAVRSTDGSGSIFIDNKNKAHLAVGNMVYLDNDNADNSFTYYPGVNGLYHWDENTPDSLYFVDAYPDDNGNDTIDIASTETGRYFNSMTCYPTLSQGPDNIIYLAYTAPSENFTNDDETIYYRHVYVKHSKDGGKTWSKAYDIIADKTLFNATEFFQETAECTFPYLAVNTDDNLHLIYQLDYTPGLHLQSTTANPVDSEDNEHIYTEIPTARLVVATKETAASAASFQFGLAPNPASNAVQLNYTMLEEGKVSVRLSDIAGRQIQYSDLGFQNAGNQSFVMPLQLNAGLYFVQLVINGKVATQKLSVK
jgi:hypothetical protein